MKTVGRRRGFTLVEMLVVIAVISLLLALMMPAIHQTRASARRVDCLSNLRQIGMALQSYHESHKGFPPGVSTPPTRPVPNDASQPPIYKDFYASYGWATRLLPYLDQRPLYDELDISRRTLEDLVENHKELRGLVEMRLEIFRCPLDPSGDTMKTAPVHPSWRPLNRGAAGNPPDPIFGGSASYVGSCGLYDPCLPNGPPPRGQNNGILYIGSFVRDADVTDGLSQTIIVGERGYFQGSATWVGTSNPQEQFGGGPGSCLGRTYWRINALPEDPGVLMTPDDDLFLMGDWTARSGFSSYHDGGANFLFADGSVRFLKETIDSRVNVEPSIRSPRTDTNPPPAKLDFSQLGVFQRLGIRDDGLPPGDF